MGVAKPQSLIMFGVIALFLYWVVQDPVGAAAMIHTVTAQAGHLLALVANRIVQFLSALN